MKTKSSCGQMLVIGVIIGLLGAWQTQAASEAFFIGSAGDHNLTTGSNWVGGSPAGDWDRMIFGSAVVDGTLNINNFNGRSGITLTSGITQDITIVNNQPLIMGAVTSDGFIDMSSATKNLTINTQYWDWSPIEWNVGAGATLFVNGGIFENGSHSLTKNGAGNAWITAAGNRTGTTIINGGALVGLRSTLGTGAVVINNGGTLYVNDQWVLCGVNGFGVAEQNVASVTVNAGGQLALDGGNGYANGATNLYLNGGSVTGGPDNLSPFGGLYLYNGNEQITAGGTTTSTITAIIALTGNNNTITVGAGSSLNVTNVLKNGIFDSSASGGIIKAGAGTLTLTAANTYSGVTTIAGGVLNVTTFSDYGVAGGLGNRAADTGGEDMGLLFQGGTLQYTGSTAQSTNRALRFDLSGGTIDASGTGPGTLSFTAASSPNWWANGGTRTFTLTGSNTGANTIATAINDIPGVTTFNLVKSGTGQWVLTGANTYNGTTTVSAGTLQIAGAGSLGSGSYAGAISIATGANLKYSSSADQTLSGINSGAGSLIKDTSGSTLYLSGANTNIGVATVSAGILKYAHAAAVGSTSGITVNNTGSVWFDPGTAGGTVSTPISLSGDGGGNCALNTYTPNGQVTFSGPITMTGSSLIRAIGDNSTLNFSNAIHGTGDFSFAAFGGGAGTKDYIVLSGASDFSGGFALVNWFGAVQATLSGGDNRLPTTALVTVRGGTGGYAGALDLNGNNQTIAGLTDTLGFGGLDAGARSVVNTSGTAVTLTLNTPADQSSGVSIGGTDINGTAGNNLAVVKSGAGTQTLTGASTYTGATTVSAGTLAGTGSLTSIVTVNSGGTLAPGIPSGAYGTFTVSGADFTGGGKLAIRATSPTSFDKLVINGNLKVQGGLLEIDLSGFSGNGEFAIAQSTAWTTGVGFTVSFLNTPGGVTSKSVSYKNSTHEILLAINTGVTPVKIADFSAKSEGAGVNVSWTCVSEYQNAGFNIYRRALESAEWTKVNPTLIAGRITNPDERKYTYFDFAPAGMYEYKLESIDLTGGREAYAKLGEVVDVDWASELAPANDVSNVVVESAMRSMEMEISAQTAKRVETLFAAARASDPVVQASRLQVSQPTIPTAEVAAREIAARSTANVSVVSNIQTQLPVAGIRWFSSGRIGTSSNYTTAKVTYNSAGVMLVPQSSMPDGFDLGSIALQREGRNMNALAKVPGGLLVYAPGYKDNYTDKDALFLRKTTAPTNAGTPSNASGLFTSSLPVNVTSSNTVTNAYHDVYFDYNLRPYSFEPWFSNKYLTQGSSQDFNVDLTDVVSSSATMVINLWSLTSSDAVNPDHGIQVLINGQAIGESSWDGGNKMLHLSFTVPAGNFKTGNNIVSLVTPTIAGQDSQISFLHSISVNYTRGLDGSKPVEITSTGGMYELYNIPATGAWVVDARFSDRASLVPTETQIQNDGTLRLRFVAQSGGSGKYIVVPAGQENSPLQVSARMVKAFKLNGTYLATGPAQFASGTQPLLMKRAKEGIRGTYVDQEQLFDYYNYGRFGPDGIRNAVRSIKPTYLLLVGRTTYDYLNYGGQNIDPLCPAYLVSTNFWAQTTSDSAFGDLGRGYPEVAVGRLPINNTVELADAINHIVSYKGIPQSGIRLHAVADKADLLVADFGTQLDAGIKVNNPDITWQENYLDRTYQTAPEVTAALKEAANGGADLIVYSGHGNAARLGAADPRILDQTSVQSWTGNTVFLQSTCTANWMAKNVDDYKSIAIQALTQSQGGISASIGTSTYMNSDVATAFMNQLLQIASDTKTRWGSVLMKTQQWAGSQPGSAFYKDLMNTEQLFGDPTMPVYTPKSLTSTPSASSTAPNATGTF